MKVFFDTNVLLDDFYERAGAAASKQAALYCVGSSHEAWIAWHTLSNVFYMVRSYSKSKATATTFIKDLLAWTEVAETTKSDANIAVNSGMSDFEDALQLAAAMACGADVLLTRNISDFKASTIPVMTPEDFLAAYQPQQ